MSGGWSAGGGAVAGGNPVTEAGGRLTLTSGTPVTTADVTAAATLYYTPYIHDRIGLYDGSGWDSHEFTEISIPLGTLTANLPYDVYVYDNAGTETGELVAWTNSTTRAVTRTRTNGVLLKTGSLTKRYVGTIRTTSTTTTEDSFANRLVWNANNRVPRPLQKTEDDDSWTYATATIRQANGDATNQVSFVVGDSEDLAQLTLSVDAQATAGAPTYLIGIGENSATSFRTTRHSHGVTAVPTANGRTKGAAELIYIPPAGYTYLTWLEYSSGATWTFYGAVPGTVDSGNDRSGLYGWVMA